MFKTVPTSVTTLAAACVASRSCPLSSVPIGRPYAPQHLHNQGGCAARQLGLNVSILRFREGCASGRLISESADQTGLSNLFNICLKPKIKKEKSLALTFTETSSRISSALSAADRKASVMVCGWIPNQWVFQFGRWIMSAASQASLKQDFIARSSRGC